MTHFFQYEQFTKFIKDYFEMVKNNRIVLFSIKGKTLTWLINNFYQLFQLTTKHRSKH